MFDESFRTRVQPLFEPMAATLARAGISANAVTVATCILALLSAVVVVVVAPRAGVALWLLSRLGDGLDGVIARVSRQSSPFGGFLDITCDMAGYAAMVIAFSLVYPQHAVAWMSVLGGYVLVITTTLALSDAARVAGTRASDTNRTFQFTQGITEAGETNVAYVVWALWPGQLEWTIWLWVAALAVTTLQRTAQAWTMLRPRTSPR